MVKNPPADARDIGDMGSVPGPGRSPGEGNGNPLQYSWTEEPGTELDMTERLSTHARIPAQSSKSRDTQQSTVMMTMTYRKNAFPFWKVNAMVFPHHQ